jgi:hypothetical protein
MKKHLLRIVAAVILLLTIICLVTPPVVAQQNLTPFPPRTNAFTSVPSFVAGSATSNVLSQAVGVWPGRGMAVFPYFAGTNASTANVIFAFTVSYDGTNWSTTTPILLTNAMNGTTAVRGFHHIPASSLDNVRAIRLQTIQNAHTASVFVTNVVWSVYPQP